MSEAVSGNISDSKEFTNDEIPPVSEVARPSRRRAVQRMFLKLCGAALTAGVAAPVHARYIEPFALDVTRHEVFLPHLPKEYEGFVIAHLTDLHRGAPTPDSVIQQAITLAQAAQPDVVVVTGDFVERFPEDAEPVAKMLKTLTPRYGIWGCLGNHDYAIDAGLVTAHLEQHCTLKMLRNSATELAPGLWISAIDDIMYGQPDTKAALANVPEDASLIFLTHNPRGVLEVSKRSCVALAGHTHGGQVVLPGFPAPVPSGMNGFPMVAGWGVFGDANLYISRGVGMSSLPIRFNCRPEVALVTLRRGTEVPKTTSDLPGRAVRKAARVARKIWRHVRG